MSDIMGDFAIIHARTTTRRPMDAPTSGRTPTFGRAAQMAVARGLGPVTSN